MSAFSAGDGGPDGGAYQTGAGRWEGETRRPGRTFPADARPAPTAGSRMLTPVIGSRPPRPARPGRPPPAGRLAANRMPRPLTTGRPPGRTGRYRPRE